MVFAIVGIRAMAATGIPGAAIPLYDAENTCADPRFPQLVGPYVVACGDDGLIDRALNIETGRHIPVSPPLSPRTTGVAFREGAARLLTLDGPTRMVSLVDDVLTDESDLTRIPTAPVAPPATDGAHFVALMAARVEAPGIRQSVRLSWGAHPMGWYPPAIAFPWVVWVDGTDNEDILMVEVGVHREPQPLATGPSAQRHVVTDGDQFVWVDGHTLTTWTPGSAPVPLDGTNTGFHAPPTVSNGVVCWEQRPSPQQPDVDIHCTDGMQAAGPGDQLYPSRYGPYLVYRTADHVWLRTTP